MLKRFLQSSRNVIGASLILFPFYKATSLYGQYPLLSIPSAYVSPSKEKGQILLDGLVKNVTLFHGHNADEVDWHIYISLSDKIKNDLTNSAKKEFSKITHDFNEIYSELMVIDDYRNLSPLENPPFGDEKFYSADVTKPFLLFRSGSDHPAWDFGVEVTRNQGGDGLDYTNNSKLKSGRVYLQGAYVNDKAHSASPIYLVKAEIHPLDAIAFAMDENGSVYSTKYGQKGWAQTFVKWRVAFFANSSYHRINSEKYLKKERRTLFYLDLPDKAYSSEKYKMEVNIKQEVQKLWDGKRKRYYSGKGYKSYSYSKRVDPKDGREKLRVSAIMKRPTSHGGIIVLDYTIRVTVNQQLK